MKKCYKSLLLTALAGVLIFALPGCGGKEKKTTTTEADTIGYLEEESAMTEIEELTLPADFPDDIAVYPDGELEMVHKLHPDSIWHFEFAIKEDFDKVASYYKDEFIKNGWTVEGEAGSTELEVFALNFLKESRTVLFDIRPDERSSDDFSETWDIAFVRMDYYPLGYFE